MSLDGVIRGLSTHTPPAPPSVGVTLPEHPDRSLKAAQKKGVSHAPPKGPILPGAPVFSRKTKPSPPSLAHPFQNNSRSLGSCEMLVLGSDSEESHLEAFKDTDAWGRLPRQGLVWSPGIRALALVFSFFESHPVIPVCKPGLGRAVTGLLQAAPGHLPSDTTSLGLGLPAGAQPSRRQGGLCLLVLRGRWHLLSLPQPLKLGQPCSGRGVPASSISRQVSFLSIFGPATLALPESPLSPKPLLHGTRLVPA